MADFHTSLRPLSPSHCATSLPLSPLALDGKLAPQPVVQHQLAGRVQIHAVHEAREHDLLPEVGVGGGREGRRHNEGRPYQDEVSAARGFMGGLGGGWRGEVGLGMEWGRVKEWQLRWTKSQHCGSMSLSKEGGRG